MCQIDTLLHEYPKKHGLSIEWIADSIGIPVGTLSRYLNPNDARPFPLRLMIPFMRACNNDYSALDLLESRIGRTAYVTGDDGKKMDSDLVASLADGAGKVVSKLVTAMADGVIDEEENESCTKALLIIQQQTSTALLRLNEMKK